MGWLEQRAIHTAPLDRPHLWKRYVDDILEIVKKNTADALTDHLNQVDPTSCIKFMFEEEQEEAIAFLDTLTVRKPDKSIKLLEYRKKTHTDQHLSFSSHHPLHRKYRCSADIAWQEHETCKWARRSDERRRAYQTSPCPIWIPQVDSRLSQETSEKQQQQQQQQQKVTQKRTSRQEGREKQRQCCYPVCRGIARKVFQGHEKAWCFHVYETSHHYPDYPEFISSPQGHGGQTKFEEHS